MYQEKMQQEKLKAVKARLNFEEISQYSESGAPIKRRDVRKRLGPKGVCSMFGSPEPRCDRSRSPRRKEPERETVFRRLEKGIFHRLGDKEKEFLAQWDCEPLLRGITIEEHTRAGEEGCQKVRIVQEDTRSLNLRSKGQVWSTRICPNHGHVKTYDGSEDPEDHLKIFQAAAKDHAWNHKPELIKRVHDQEPKICIMNDRKITTVFLRGEVAAGNQERKKALPP
ncbi:hypothetical protein Tco_0024659 [Tanacetum coccineum]